jgi:SapC
MTVSGPNVASQLWERPIALEKDVLSRRIYAPLAYGPVRNTAVVPIVHSECMILASWFPLVWRERQSRIEFVAIRALLDDQRAQPPAARAVLPSVLHAYPFMHDPGQPITVDSQKMLDDVFADAPTDIGASITTVQRKLARATMSRFQILDRFAHESSATSEISRALLALDLLEPWSLKFDIDGHRVEIPNLLVVRPAAVETGDFASLLENHGLPCAQMLALHRISLFRSGSLLARAKTFFRESRETGASDPQAEDFMSTLSQLQEPQRQGLDRKGAQTPGHDPFVQQSPRHDARIESQPAPAPT